MTAQVRESTSLTVWTHRLLDGVIPAITLYLTGALYNNLWSEKYQILAILSGLLILVFNQFTGVYSQWRGRTLFSGSKLILKGWFLTWLALLAVAFLFKDSALLSRVVLTVWAITTPFILILYRLLLRSLLGKFRVLGWNTRRVAILGAGELGQRLAGTLIDAKMLGYIPTAFFDYDESKQNKKFFGVPVTGTIEGFLNKKHYARDFDEIYITLPLRAEEKIKEILNVLADSTVTVKFIPDCFAFDLLHSQITDIGGIPIISVYDSPLNNLSNKFIKRSEDIFLSTIILLLISPLLLFISIGIKVTSPGPIIFKQTRVSWNGENFNIYKFRSMPVNTDEKKLQWGSAKEKTNTKFGSFIRKTSLDELPQFFNTLKGDMSIVGPRPERDVFVEKFRKDVPRYMQKHMTKAGITGWAQINGWRGDTSIEKRVQFDLYYIDHWSVWLDIKIILLTIVKGFINKNAY
ncbi:MAG: undecaprenyl-phosphate glucose phosphotransferase [Gammaproteobacteria bacterium]|nr:undecaprenyl-phosphate glucose phosphotransferase [Gammaproteobacteria bacterium]